MTDVSAIVELISGGWGLLTSVGFKVVPFLDNWLYVTVPENKRGLVFLGLSLVVPVGILGVSCAGLYNLVPCVPDIWKDLVRAWLTFVIANVGIFTMTPDSKAKQLVKSAKAGLLNGIGRKAVQHPVEEIQE
jgi:hypothetical protein